jgi:hypothetical protein
MLLKLMRGRKEEDDLSYKEYKKEISSWK